MSGKAQAMALEVRDLVVTIGTGGEAWPAVDGVSFEVGARECVALLGESGCGKSLTALALMRLLPEGVEIAGGAVKLDGQSLFDLPEHAMRKVRGGQLAMIFQEPQTSLNPVLTIGQQLVEAVQVHRARPDLDPHAETARLLEAVGLEAARLAAYPFNLSGGQRQRALIAMMLAGNPRLLIADEPTTALDVTVQAQILRLLRDLQREQGMGLLLITHDLDVARDMADRVAVMYAGQIVEWATREALYAAPAHPYTRQLFEVLPSVDRRGERLAQIPGRVPGPGEAQPGCRFANRCPAVQARCQSEAPGLRDTGAGHWVRCHLAGGELALPSGSSANPVARSTAGQGGARPAVLELRDLAVYFPIRGGLLQRKVGEIKAVDGVSLTLAAGETLALVGESGCGKTTLARAALRLLQPTAGQVRLDGEDITRLEGEALRRKRRDMQIVFQDPFSSLNPRMRIGEVLEEGLLSLKPELSRAARAARVAELLALVGLSGEVVQRYPHEFSGGQRQRLAIARALAVEPRLLICDEPTSALDVSIQAQILNLLADLQASQGLAYLFITHNLPVVGYLAHQVAVMYRGRIVEAGAAEALLSGPAHPYTRLLLASAPGRGLESQAVGGSVRVSSGCGFAPRCPQATDRCWQVSPAETRLPDGRRVSCHGVDQAPPVDQVPVD